MRQRIVSATLLSLVLTAALSITVFAQEEPHDAWIWTIKKNLKARTPILVYHDVIESRGPDSLWFDCSVSELNAQLDWMTARGAHFITADQMYDHLVNGKSLPSNAVMITFADGYEGFYTRAYPIFRRRRIPVAMFVHTDYVGDGHNRPKMTWEQLIELDRSGLVTIGSETRSHPADLRTLDKAQLREEMVGSKSALESKLGHPIRYLAYPNGKYDLRVAAAAQMAGYLMAFTEHQTPAELSAIRFTVDRYNHTKYRQAWRDAGRR